MASTVVTYELCKSLNPSHSFREYPVGPLHVSEAALQVKTSKLCSSKYSVIEGNQTVSREANHDLAGLRKNDRLQRNIVTPTTKAKEGDVPVSAEEVIDDCQVWPGRMRSGFNRCSEKAKDLRALGTFRGMADSSGMRVQSWPSLSGEH